jgi:hypothetical protein
MQAEWRNEMKIELKNVKHSEFASHETNCFEATIYVDGKKAGHTENSGQGGPTNISPNTLVLMLEEYAKTLPPLIYKSHANDTIEITEIKQDAELLIDELLMNWLCARDLKRALTNKIVFTREGQILQTVKLTPTAMEQYLCHPTFHQRLKADEILNMIPFNKALEIYRSAA